MIKAQQFQKDAEAKAFDREHRRKIRFNIGKYDAAVSAGMKLYDQHELARDRGAYLKATVLEKLDHTTSNIDSLLSKENQQALQSTLVDIATIARTVAARKDTIDAGIKSAARTFEHTERATRQIEPTIQQIARTAEAIEIASQKATIAINNANQTVNSVGGDVSRFTTESLPEVQRLLEELNALAASLRHLSEQTERDPASLIRGRNKVPPGPGE